MTIPIFIRDNESTAVKLGFDTDEKLITNIQIADEELMSYWIAPERDEIVFYLKDADFAGPYNKSVVEMFDSILSLKNKRFYND